MYCWQQPIIREDLFIVRTACQMLYNNQKKLIA